MFQLNTCIPCVNQRISKKQCSFPNEIFRGKFLQTCSGRSIYYKIWPTLPLWPSVPGNKITMKNKTFPVGQNYNISFYTVSPYFNNRWNCSFTIIRTITWKDVLHVMHEKCISWKSFVCSVYIACRNGMFFPFAFSKISNRREYIKKLGVNINFKKTNWVIATTILPMPSLI